MPAVIRATAMSAATASSSPASHGVIVGPGSYRCREPLGTALLETAGTVVALHENENHENASPYYIGRYAGRSDATASTGFVPIFAQQIRLLKDRRAARPCLRRSGDSLSRYGVDTASSRRHSPTCRTRCEGSRARIWRNESLRSKRRPAEPPRRLASNVWPTPATLGIKG
jgi:hypothetical protein